MLGPTGGEAALAGYAVFHDSVQDTVPKPLKSILGCALLCLIWTQVRGKFKAPLERFVNGRWHPGKVSHVTYSIHQADAYTAT